MKRSEEHNKKIQASLMEKLKQKNPGKIVLLKASQVEQKLIDEGKSEPRDILAILRTYTKPDLTGRYEMDRCTPTAEPLFNGSRQIKVYRKLDEIIRVIGYVD